MGAAAVSLERHPSSVIDRPRAEIARWQLAGGLSEDAPDLEAVPKQLVRSGAVGAMGRSLGKLAHAA